MQIPHPQLYTHTHSKLFVGPSHRSSLVETLSSSPETHPVCFLFCFVLFPRHEPGLWERHIMYILCAGQNSNLGIFRSFSFLFFSCLHTHTNIVLPPCWICPPVPAYIRFCPSHGHGPLRVPLSRRHLSLSLIQRLLHSSPPSLLLLPPLRTGHQGIRQPPFS